MNKKKKFFQLVSAFLAILTFLFMIFVNALANILPINGRNTGEISDDYPNLFAPTGLTFAIWGVIYFLLFIYIVYQSYYILHDKEDIQNRKELLSYINLFFAISSLSNAAWIFAWHYKVIWLSLILMFILLACLIKINRMQKNTDFSKLEKVTCRLPFLVYFGWVTVATIANVTVFLVSIHWNRFSLSEVFWTDCIVFVGAAIGCFCIYSFQSIAYGLVLLWAYLGIVIKHISPSQFHFKYPSVIACVLISMCLFLLSIVRVIYHNYHKK